MTNSVIQKFLVFVFFGIVASGCALEDDPSVTAKKDLEKPTLTEVTAVSSPTSDSTPNYTFNSTESGTITYGGSCSSSTTSATSGNNTITLVSLSERTYSDCTITVTDEAGNVSNTLTITSFTVDFAPTVTEVTSVTTPTNDTTPDYTFSSDEAGTITYGGSCSSTTSSATSGNNSITFNSLSDGTYSNCTITVTDTAGNTVTLNISSFIVDTTTPTISEVTVVTNPTNDSTPNYTFNSTESGTITYGGSCSSSTTSATSGNNTITLVSLSERTYSDCTITVTDAVGYVSNTLTITSFIVDQTAATLVEVTVVTTPTNDTTPDYTFSSSEAGTITYGGSCSSSTTSATTDNNTITLVSLSEDTYSDCTITVTDNASNSVTLNISSFVIDTTVPTFSSISPTDNQTGVSISDNISVTFSESMDNTSVTTNTDNTTCYGSFALSSDNFTSCVQMSSSPSSSNLYKTFTIDPSDNLSQATTYKTRVKTGIKDSAGNSLSSQYETSNGFTTETPSFVAVGTLGTVITSLDGITWTSRTSVSSTNLGGASYFNDSFWMVQRSGIGGIIHTSKYGISWDNITTGFSVNLRDIKYGNSKYVAIGCCQHNIFTSSDGISWDNQSLTGTGLFEDLIYDNGTFVAVGTSGQISTSTDGISWVDRKIQGNHLYGVTYGNSTFVAVGTNGLILTSSDGSTWTERLSINNSVATSPNKQPPTTSSLYKVTYGNSKFVAVGEYGAILTSPDGTTWTSSFTFGNLGTFQAVTYGNGIFVVVGSGQNWGGATVITSTDGTTWTERTSGASSFLLDVTYGE
jgi:hypothetical protein